jgi:hypothetical protein
MNLTIADICLLIGTIGIHFSLGYYFYNKMKDLYNKRSK